MLHLVTSKIKVSQLTVPETIKVQIKELAGPTFEELEWS